MGRTRMQANPAVFSKLYQDSRARAERQAQRVLKQRETETEEIEMSSQVRVLPMSEVFCMLRHKRMQEEGQESTPVTAAAATTVLPSPPVPSTSLVVPSAQLDRRIACLLDKGEKGQQRRAELQQEHIERERSACTFRPAITQSASEAAGHGDVFASLYDNAAARQRTRFLTAAEARLKKEQQEAQQCTFQPDTSRSRVSNRLLRASSMDAVSSSVIVEQEAVSMLKLRPAQAYRQPLHTAGEE